MNRKIRKAVFPVAGFGTRFLPVTKAMPKELLPIVDKPLIQYAAEHAISAGIDTLIFVTGRNKRAIEEVGFKVDSSLKYSKRMHGRTMCEPVLNIDLKEVPFRGVKIIGGDLKILGRGYLREIPKFLKIINQFYLGNMVYLQPHDRLDKLTPYKKFSTMQNFR